MAERVSERLPSERGLHRGAAGFDAIGGAGGAAICAATTAAAAGTATFGVWSDVAFAIGGTAVSFGFSAFGGIWGAEVWKDLGGR